MHFQGSVGYQRIASRILFLDINKIVLLEHQRGRGVVAADARGGGLQAQEAALSPKAAGRGGDTAPYQTNLSVPRADSSQIYELTADAVYLLGQRIFFLGHSQLPTVMSSSRIISSALGSGSSWPPSRTFTCGLFVQLTFNNEFS
mmetsp:Transcript_38977/g.66362  ORF Transcript_38977/g.66362 Transcript_38977/m.66362 type:complete len:145 (-) Transcript_38977:199-633(-)